VLERRLLLLLLMLLGLRVLLVEHEGQRLQYGPHHQQLKLGLAIIRQLRGRLPCGLRQLSALNSHISRRPSVSLSHEQEAPQTRTLSLECKSPEGK
jgi:hypothetical protein